MVCQAALRLDPYPTYDDNLNRCLYGDQYRYMYRY